MLPLENITVGQLLRRTAQRVPQRPALEYSGNVWTYEQFDRQVDTAARQLLDHGVQKGDHVGVYCEAEPNAIFAMYAIMRIGAVVTMLNTSLQRTELRDLLAGTDVRVLLIGDGYKNVDYREQCVGLTEELPTLEHMFYIGLNGNSKGCCPALGNTAPSRGSVQALALAQNAVLPQDTACILYTSGTTSKTKAVLGSHFSRANSGIQQAHDLQATQEDRFCVAMPIFHCFCMTVNIMAACAVGACLCLPVSRRTTALLQTISSGRCTVLSCVAALYHAVLARPDFEDWDISSLRTGFIGGNMYPPELFCEIEKRFHMTLLSSLGQTEATAGITTAYMDDSLEVRATTVGHFMNHVEGKIQDTATKETLPAGCSGEICVRGYVVMQGYYKLPEQTAQTVDTEGWLHTGDTGYLDEAGNLHLIGRLKDLIIRGGENISPAELENALLTDPEMAACVKACRAVGVPDAHYGEEVCLCIEPKAGAGCDPQKARCRLMNRLAAFKVPRYIILMDEIPSTTTGKIRTEELRTLAKEKLDL